MTIVKTIKGCYNMENQVFRSTEEWEEYVGAQIRSLRQDEHLTQKALANRANVSLSSLQSLELGRGSSLTTVVKSCVHSVAQTGSRRWLLRSHWSVPESSGVSQNSKSVAE